MTTTVNVHVNGRYRATVVQTAADGTVRPPVIVEGNYEGSPNPSGAHIFYLSHPAESSFKITEEQVPAATSAPDAPAA